VQIILIIKILAAQKYMRGAFSNLCVTAGDQLGVVVSELETSKGGSDIIDQGWTIPPDMRSIWYNTY
jgi:hypothetical protein